MPDTREIRIASLRLDTVNPRLDDGEQSQRNALTAMLEAQGDKVVVLARDISKNGLSPIDRFLVMPAEDNAGEFIVLEGNRRITALKLLANPELGAGVLRNTDVKKLKALGAGTDFKEDSEIDCAVVASRDEADHWLRLRHGGELGGAGVVDWGATEKERFDARSGKASPELQILRFLTTHDVVTVDEANDISITALRRLLNDAAVRGKLGIEIDRKQQKVSTHFPEKEVLKGLGKMAHELAADDFRVGKIYTEDDRKKFMRGFKPTELPNPRAKLSKPVDLDGSAGEGSAAKGKGKRGGGRSARHRATVAPGSLRLKIGQHRIKDIYIELQGLKLEKFANAGAVLLRVFLELTVDHYIPRHNVAVKKSDPKLSDKLQAVHDDLIQRGVMQKSELAPIRKAISDPGLLAASVSTFNLYVHSDNLSPSPRDVRTAWNNLQLFFERIWQ